MGSRESRDIRLHAHCARCARTKPANQSPSEWSRLDAGLTATGLQVWCKRCGIEVFHFTPEALGEMLQNARCSCCPGGIHSN